MPDIIDLDALVPADKNVTFAGRVWKLPGDMPLTTYLKVNNLAAKQEEGASQEDLLLGTVDAIAELFCWNVAESQRESRTDELTEKMRGMGLRTIMQMLSTIYPADEVGDEEVDADEAVESAPDPSTTGTTSTTT